MDYRHITTCQIPHRHNKPAGQVDVNPGVEICVTGILATCRDHRHVTACQNQHRQIKSAGQEDVRTKVEVPLMGDARHM